MTIAPSESWTIAPVNLNEAGVGKRLAQRRSVKRLEVFLAADNKTDKRVSGIATNQHCT